MRKYIAIIRASLALFTGQAHAQRCLPKMQGIEVRANMCWLSSRRIVRQGWT